MHHPTLSDADDGIGAPRQLLPQAQAQVPEYRTDFRALDRPITAAALQPISLQIEALDAFVAEGSSRVPAYARSLGTAPPMRSDPVGSPGNPCGPAANDDAADGSVQVKRTYQRRKPRREDRRCNTTSLTILPQVYDQARTAFANATTRGLPLDTMVTLRPVIFEGLTPQERYVWTKKRVNAMRQLFADNDDLPEFAALWSRESTRVRAEPPYGAKGEHLHLLVHTAGAREPLRKALHKSFSRREAFVDPADDVVRRLDNGQLGDASTYLLKAVHQNVWRTYPATPHRPSGEIYGPRVGWTRNILNELPVRRPASRVGG